MTVEIKLSNNQKTQVQSVKAIYNYFYDTFVKGSISADRRRQIQERFAHRQCLWDESTGKFWQPKHAFLDEVPFFGNRRTTIPSSNSHSEVYQLLGQRSFARSTRLLRFPHRTISRVRQQCFK